MRKIRQRAAAPILTIIFAIVSLFIIGHYTKDYDNLFFACPQIDATVPIDKTSEMNLTYETPSERAGIKIFSVSHAYSRIMNYSMTSGSFFTRVAQDEKRKNVVLNEKLAFETFGSFDIIGNIYNVNNQPYVVVGVVDDRQDENHAYIPASETAGNFLAVIETEEKTIADLKSLGVNENRFHLVNISGIAGVVRDKPWLAIIVATIVLLAYLINKTVRQIVRLAKKIKLALHEKYWSELIKSRGMCRFIMIIIMSIIEIAAALWLFLKSVAMALRWGKCAGGLNEIPSLAFGGRIQLLKDLCLYSNIAFCVFIGGMLLGGIAIAKHKQSL